MAEIDRDFSDVPKVAREQEVVEEYQGILQATFPLIIDRLLLMNENNPEDIEGLIHDIINLAGRTGATSIAIRRHQSEIHKVDPHNDLYYSPDQMTTNQDATLHSHEALSQLIENLPKLLRERAELVAEGKSPLQKSNPNPMPGIRDNTIT